MTQRRLLTTRQAAEYLNKPIATIRWWRYAGKGPRWFKVGGSVMYDAADIENWLKSNLHEPSVRANVEATLGSL